MCRRVMVDILENGWSCQEEGKEEAAGEFHGCSEGIHAESWFNF